jgi:hypothetical protein
MKKILIVLTLFVFITSCYNSSKPKKPKNLISKDQMVEILIDVSLINSAKGFNKSIIETNGIKPDSFIYRKHNIDSLQFVLSNEYYTYNLNEYLEIISQVEDSLNVLRRKYDILADKDSDKERELDSIKRSKRKKEVINKENPLNTKVSEKN